MKTPLISNITQGQSLVPEKCKILGGCAECGDKKLDRSGLCFECFEKWAHGAIVKTYDTLDKEKWSCGCYGRPEGVFYCEFHGFRGTKGPLGVYNKDLDMDLMLEKAKETPRTWSKASPKKK